MKTSTKITRADYMKNPNELHHSYYLQFATESTKNYVLSGLKVEDIKNALNNGDKHLNKIKIPYDYLEHGGSWWWDGASINMELLKELGESNSPSTHTCVAKAVAKELAK